MRYATTCPRVTNSTFRVTSLPLNIDGASSAMYRGVTKLAAPTARPIIERPITMIHTEVVRACNRAPRMKRMSAIRMTRFRPRESARRPLTGETRSAKREVDAAIKDLSSVVRAREDRDVPMETKVADITPVSSGLSSSQPRAEIRSRKQKAEKKDPTSKQQAADTGREC
jgi:hypothetical protein